MSAGVLIVAVPPGPPTGLSMSAFSQSDAVLALADGTVWYGARFGAPGRCAAEIVFNTAMFGYQEILTDPSYCDQIVVFTCPHVGNVRRQCP